MGCCGSKANSVAGYGCCTGQYGCIGGWLIMLSMLQLGNLPVSVPGIMLGSSLVGCCCQTDIAGISCRAGALTILSMIMLLVQFGSGLFMLAPDFKDMYCAALFGQTTDFYKFNKDYVDLGAPKHPGPLSRPTRATPSATHPAACYYRVTY